MTSGLKVGVIGCGLIGNKRVEALDATDVVVAVFDVDASKAAAMAQQAGAVAAGSIDEVLAERPDVVVVAATHDQLAPITAASLRAGADVLVEKPGGVSAGQIEELLAVEQATGRRVKVGFNHRFHPALRDLQAEVSSGAHGEFMHLRARYGHGGRPGYDREWRAQPSRSGGGELIDQGMHLIDLTHWIAGPLPLHSALLRTQFWDTDVDDNAALILGASESRDSPWAMLHVTWTEWKNMFSLEAYCRTAKLQLDGLVRSYGPQTLTIHRMAPDLGPPETEVRSYGTEDLSWRAEWQEFKSAIADRQRPMLGGLADALYAWQTVEAAYATSAPYQAMRAQVGA